jgi:uncharacterized RDD family membrane protein YckC
MREGVAVGVAGSLQYAGFWLRFGAYLLDSLLLGAVNFIMQLVLGFFVAAIQRGSPGASANPAVLVLGLLVILIAVAIPVSYEVIMIGKYGATLGKMACKIRVVRADGSRVSYGLALGRMLSKIVSALMCYIGFMMAGWDEEKRALHDRMCDTRVVYRQP